MSKLTTPYDTDVSDISYAFVDELIVQTRDACIVTLTVIIAGTVEQFQGTARRAKGEKDDPTSAILLATGRAYEGMARRTTKVAWSRIDQQDEIIRVQPLQAAAKQRWLAMHPDTPHTASIEVGEDVSKARGMFSILRGGREQQPIASVAAQTTTD